MRRGGNHCPAGGGAGVVREVLAGTGHGLGGQPGRGFPRRYHRRRTHAGKDKTFVIDFANDPEEIVAAFKMFYRDAQVSDVQDPNVVYDIKQRLDGMLLYEASEVEAFGKAIVDRNVTHQRLFALTQPATDRYNGKLKQLNGAIEQWERAWDAARQRDDPQAMTNADAQRSELAKERDALMIFSESLSKFVRTYEYVAQLVEFGDPSLEAFASYARLLRKRLKGIATEQVDLSGLTLTHHAMQADSPLAGISGDGESPALDPITSVGQRDPRDREKAYLSELIVKLNAAFGKGISDKDKVAFVVHVSEKLRDDAIVMAQVENNPREQAMKASLPGATIKAIVEAMTTHQELATQLLKEESTRGLFIDVVYELLKKNIGLDLFSA